MDAGTLDQRLTIQSVGTAQDATYGSPTIVPVTFATVWGKVADAVTTRRGGDVADKEDVRVSAGRSKVLIRYLPGLVVGMRIFWAARSRTMVILSIAETGRRDGHELECEDYSV